MASRLETRPAGTGSASPDGEAQRLAVGPVATVAVAFVALEMAVSARYGFHRDELYFLSCARHLAWGYVDQPPLVPVVAWLSTHLFGTSPTAIRVVPALAGAGVVLITGRLAAEFGGGRRAQILAAIGAATSAQMLAAVHTLSTAGLDMFFWTATTLLMVRVLRTGRNRGWLAVGGFVGVALLNKWNILFLVVGLGAGLIAAGRGRLLLNRWVFAGAALSVAIWSPNLVWNAQHHWAEVQMLSSLHRENSTLAASVTFIPLQFIVVGPALVVLWPAGLRRLLRSGLGRPFGIGYLILVALFTLSGGKSYYLGGMYGVLFAAGAVWAEERLARKGRGLRGWLVLIGAGGLAAVLLALPVLPESTLARGPWEGKINKDLSATVGWKDFVSQVASVAAGLPRSERAHLVVFTGDYGAAGAVDLYGRGYGLPPAISGHNSYWWWGPSRATTGGTTIAVNLPQTYLATIFSSVVYAGAVSTPHGVWSEERGDPIWICTGPRQSWAAAWPAARHYD